MSTFQQIVAPGPLIVVPEPGRMRWKRDPGITQVIEYFDRPERKNNPQALAAKEWAFIVEETRRCREDFSYAARNYFWISGKRGEDLLLRLWPSQELILEKMAWLKGKGKAQKIMIVKARQLGISVLAEALIAWLTMFNVNRNALVVSNRQPHCEYLFGIMLHIYDMMPWWLKPMISSRQYDAGLQFQNPDPDQIYDNPGLKSKVIVQAATSAGVGQGVTLHGAHISEYADYHEDKAKEIIEGDMVYALAEGPQTFALLESTAKGAGTYAEDLWLANVSLAEHAEWYPLFLPWFFEKTRVTAPEGGWHPEKSELQMRERVQLEWVRCSNCEEYREATDQNKKRLAGSKCPDCGKGTFAPVVLADEQLRWMWEQRINKERKGSEAVKELKAELCTTAEGAFQLSGIQVFPQDCHDFVQTTICEVLKYPGGMIGNLDSRGQFHGVDWTRANLEAGYYPCYQASCPDNHLYDEHQPLKIWELPRVDKRYTCGVDVSEGVGEDYSVCWVNRIGENGSPDMHVATYRSNQIPAADFAFPVNHIGRWYNDALMSIEYNYPSTADMVRIYYQYPNLFQWKHEDSKNMVSHKLHWETNYKSKPRLWQTAIRFLKAGLWVVRDPLLAAEMKRFQKEDYEDRKARAERGSHDDLLMASMICLYTSHDLDWDDNTQSVYISSQVGMLDRVEWAMHCLACGHTWGADNPEHNRFCPACGAYKVTGKSNAISNAPPTVDFAELVNTNLDSEGVLAYDLT